MKTWGQLENVNQQDQLSAQWMLTHNKAMGTLVLPISFKSYSMIALLLKFAVHAFPKVTEN